jgi:hypothetical protein
MARPDALKAEIKQEHRAFLDKYNLKLTGFLEELTMNSADLPLVQKEQDALKAHIVEQYDNRIAQFMQRKEVEEWYKKGELQKRLNDRLSMARERARTLLKHEINAAARRPSSVPQ